MSGVLVTWSLIILVIAGVAIWQFVRRRRTTPQPDPGCTPDGAWQHYFTAAGSASERDRRAIQAFPSLGAQDAESIRNTIHDILNRGCADASPQTALRVALMDATDRFALRETIHKARHSGHGGSPLDEDADHVGAVIEAGVIRTFATLRLGDGADDDWYTHYLGVAQMNSNNVAAMVRKTVKGESANLESSLHDPLTRKMQDVRTALLAFPPRQPVTRAHQFGEGDSRRLHPTRRQADRLTKAMGARFERLFAGQVYGSPDGSPIDRSDVFRLDAGLLYCVLAQRFRHADDAWIEIMSESLGSFRDVVESRHGLLEAVRGYHGLWREHEAEGPLQAIVEAACGEAGEGPESATATLSGSTRSAVMLDASHLVGKLRKIVDEHDDSPAVSDPRLA